MMKIKSVRFFLLLMLLAMGMAQANDAAVLPEVQDRVGPAAALQQGLAEMLGFLKDNQDVEASVVAGFLGKDIAPYFDFVYMAKSAAGPLYRQMTVEQRLRMAATIEQQFLSTMAERLAGYTNQQVKLIKERVNRDRRTGRVTIAVLNPRGYPSRLDFRLYKTEGKWKVFDVMANGQSAVLFYRRQFRQTMYGSRTYRR